MSIQSIVHIVMGQTKYTSGLDLGCQPLTSALNTKTFFNPLLGYRLSSWLYMGAGRVDRRLAVEFLLATWITFGKRSGAGWKGSLGRQGELPGEGGPGDGGPDEGT